MKIIIKESQNQKLEEYFSPIKDLGLMMNYYLNLDKGKPIGLDSFQKYKWAKAFQKYVDLIFRYTKKDFPLDGVKGFKVNHVSVNPWGEDFSNPDRPPSRLDWKVRLEPDFDLNNFPESEELYQEQLENFINEFKKASTFMGLETIQPVEDKKTKNISIDYSFTKPKLHLWKKHRNLNESENKGGWGNSDKKLERKFKFKDFNNAIEFVNKIAKIAEKQNHHPDIEINFNKVKISITDHEEGGVSDKCHKFVDEVNKLIPKKKTEELQEKCWPGYEKKGMKTMFGKRYPNCVKKKK